MDAGSYPVGVARTIAGTTPARVGATSRWAASGVDLTTLATLEFSNGLLAQISCSFATTRHRHAFIAGDAGSISTTYLNDTSPEFPRLLEARHRLGCPARDDRDRFDQRIPGRSPGLPESRSFRPGWIGATPEESVDIAPMLDALAQSARKGSPVDVAW